MATLYVSFVGGIEYDVAKSPMRADTLTTSGTSAKTTTNPGACIAIVFSDAAHYVNTGPADTVTAAATAGIYVPAGVQREIALAPSDEVAAITA